MLGLSIFTFISLKKRKIGVKYNDKKLSLITVTVFEDGEFVEQAAWDILHKEKEVEKKKEILRRYNQAKIMSKE